MKKENIFYLIFVLTILIIRTGVFLFPQRKIIIDGTIIHHFWIGVVLMLFVLLLPSLYMKLKIVTVSIGFGAMADELAYIALSGNTVSEYWSFHSVFGAIITMILIFILRKKITTLLITAH